MSLELRIGDVFERMAEIPDGSIDLIVTSPPFLALRSYLPADHPDKAKEIGSEATPAAFIDTLLALSAEWGRVLAPHGSLCVELGDTYSGAGGYGNPDSPNPAYGQPRFEERWEGKSRKRFKKKDDGWPLAKSLTGIPTLYPWSLAYGRNLLTGQPSPAGQWRIRNIIVWARPNPPVGALGDKFRPATSYITVACRGARRYFDLDAVRGDVAELGVRSVGGASGSDTRGPGGDFGNADKVRPLANPAGAPPLDWHSDLKDGDWLWKLSTQPYAGSHYATFPMALPKRLIEAMCPLRVCTVCGRPSERIVERDELAMSAGMRTVNAGNGGGRSAKNGRATTQEATGEHHDRTINTTLGWSDCGHNSWRTGVVLDPFAGSGTTLEAAQAVGRHAIGIDFDPRNADLAQQRVGMFLTVEGAA
jgi:site-specific DNA-methyltransferase (adenine-specific)